MSCNDQLEVLIFYYLQKIAISLSLILTSYEFYGTIYWDLKKRLEVRKSSSLYFRIL
jgi:hypothetical protein